MSEAKFTSGDWNVQFGDMIFASDGINNEQVAIICNDDNQDKHLIAAAPEMYQALELMVRYAQMLEEQLMSRRVEVTTLYLDNKNEQPPEDVAESALAKARGEHV